MLAGHRSRGAKGSKMYYLSEKYLNEFQKTLTIIRFDYPLGEKTKKPALLLQANTLLLKYITQNCKVNLIAMVIQDKLLYAIRIWDDDKKPVYLWSFLEYEEEKNALIDLADNGFFNIFVFNELSVCEAWKPLRINKSNKLLELITTSDFNKTEQILYKDIVNQILDDLTKHQNNSFFNETISNTDEWNFNNSVYITNQGSLSSIALNYSYEGNQQEQIAFWIVDNLLPTGAFHSPKIRTTTGSREFTDLLLSYEDGCFIFESKALSVFQQQKLPPRSTLEKNVEKHITKALKQLKGTVRQLQLGTPIYTNDLSVEIHIEWKKINHCIIVLSDLSTIQNSEIVGKKVIEDFMKTTNSYLHIVDLTELQRLVQAANIIAKNSTKISVLKAFDYYLVERAKKTIEIGNLNINMLLKIEK
jgi:hypothetical protein